MTIDNDPLRDDADTAAKKVAKDLKDDGWYTKDGNGKDKDKKHPHYVQKYTEPALIAEAVIVGGIPSFR